MRGVMWPVDDRVRAAGCSRLYRSASQRRHQIQSPYGRYPDPAGDGKISGKQSLFLQTPRPPSLPDTKNFLLD